MREILQSEKQGDWQAVELKSLELIAAIHEGRCGDIPVEIYRILDDFDIRRSDSAYAENQHASLEAYLS